MFSEQRKIDVLWWEIGQNNVIFYNIYSNFISFIPRVIGFVFISFYDISYFLITFQYDFILL